MQAWNRAGSPEIWGEVAAKGWDVGLKWGEPVPFSWGQGRGLVHHCHTHTRLSFPWKAPSVCCVVCQVVGGSVSLPRKWTFSPRLKRNESSSSVQNYFHLDSLQKKLKDLEEENVVLRSEVKCTPCPVPSLPGWWPHVLIWRVQPWLQPCHSQGWRSVEGLPGPGSRPHQVPSRHASFMSQAAHTILLAADRQVNCAVWGWLRVANPPPSQLGQKLLEGGALLLWSPAQM